MTQQQDIAPQQDNDITHTDFRWPDFNFLDVYIPLSEAR